MGCRRGSVSWNVSVEGVQGDGARDEEQSQDSDDSMSDVKRWKLERLKRAARLSQLNQEQGTAPQPDVSNGDEAYTSQEESDEQGATARKRRFISPSPSVSPDRQLPSAIQEEEGGYVSRSPSRSPDREGYISRSPSRSPDRSSGEEGQLEAEEGGYVSRSPSRSPDRD